MSKQHHYNANILWTGNRGEGTTSYKAFGREHTISIENKTAILGSSDPAFRGDKTKHNPEDLFLASLAACHMLWYLHLCAETGIVVTNYSDNATAIMAEMPNGSGKFIAATLNPSVTITNPDLIEKANALHKKANEFCFIANSVNFPVLHNPTTVSN
ncbi:OsmC family protein [Flavobacterium agricola]|uniref:OsmC family protein n=1 Tax=Flavobacterium agricola TaxID=2870839 RepID=A0ABY6M2L8_9FLAO|nr:OsmC family protein [Flavobacterium agricola]UYW01899.1 OsmC family protein [Flavobacterium agricola]